MLGKIVITLLVLATAWAVLRRRADRDTASGKSAGRTPKSLAAPEPGPSRGDDKKAAEGREWRLALYGFVGFVILIGAGLYYSQWRRDHEVLTVRLIRGDQQITSYQVYRHALAERRFVTVDGISVTVAADERMEVDGLD